LAPDSSARGAHTFEFLVNKLDFLLLSLGLSQIALDLFLQLRASLLELRLLTAPGLPAQVKQLILRSDCTTGFGISVLCPFEQCPRKDDLVGIVALGLEARASYFDR
jgi:hypothetical protein